MPLASPVRPILGLLAASLTVFIGAASAHAATTIGEANNTESSCAGNITIHQAASAPGSPSYRIPAGGGVLVSWRYQAGATADQVKFLVLRQTAANEIRVVHASPVRTMTPNTVNASPARVRVQAGDLIGLHLVSADGTCANLGGQPGDLMAGCAACDPAEGTTYTTEPEVASARVNVAATLEADADGDGFGDETQDQCTTDPSAQEACPVPTIAGVAKANSLLTATPGGRPQNASLQWFRCDRVGASCSPIGGAVGATYRAGGEDVGHALRFRKTATNSSGRQMTDSAATSTIAADPRRCSTRFAGTTIADRLVGTAGGDRLLGLAGNDRLSGGRGRDCLSGQGGRDRLSGGSADDSVSGGSGADRLSGGSGKDRLSGGSGNDLVSGGSGNDLVSGGSGNDRISGGSGKDRISGGSGNDRVSGGSGADRLSGGGGKNVVSAGSGNDSVNVANHRKDVVSCGAGRRDSARVDAKDVVRGCERVRVRG